MTDVQKADLCNFCGVLPTDESAVKVLEGCYEAAKAWYRENDVDVVMNPDAKFWIKNLTSWVYDNRGRSDAVIPAFIVTSVHLLREA